MAFLTFGDLLISLLDCNFFEVGLHFIFKKKKSVHHTQYSYLHRLVLTLKLKEKKGSKILGAWEAGVSRAGEASQAGGPGSCGQGTVQRASGLGVIDLSPLLFTHSLYELGQMINHLQA